ncbi:MAG: MFS transporter [Holosporales bacterium]|jgi:MFS family permease|nr:MFS transporter [Holosporales bacterium]
MSNGERINDKNLTKAWTVWGIASFFYLYEMVLRVSPSVMTNEMMVSFNATTTMLGVLVSFYYYAYTLFQLPCGFVLDRIGPRNLLGVSTVLCGIGALIFAHTEHLYVAEIGRFLIGAGSACAFISSLHVASVMFPAKYFVTLAGATNMMGTLGGLFGELPVAKLVNTIGWRQSLYLFAILGFVLLILILAFIPKNEPKVKASKKKGYSESITATIVVVAKNKQILFSAIVAALMYLPIAAFSELWAVPFFMSKCGVNNEVASIVSSALFIGVAVGSVLLAMVARKWNSYMKVIKLSAVMISLLFVLLIYTDVGLYASYAIVFTIGIFTGAQVINFTCVRNNSTGETLGAALAWTNAIIMFVGSIFQSSLGYLLDLFWNGCFSEGGTRVYDVVCYRKSFVVLPLAVLVAYVVALLVKETIGEGTEERISRK